MMEVPITVIFGIEDTVLPIAFEDGNNTNIAVNFKASYRKQNRNPLYIDNTGMKRLGDTITNNLI